MQTFDFVCRGGLMCKATTAEALRSRCSSAALSEHSTASSFFTSSPCCALRWRLPCAPFTAAIAAMRAVSAVRIGAMCGTTVSHHGEGIGDEEHQA